MSCYGYLTGLTGIYFIFERQKVVVWAVTVLDKTKLFEVPEMGETNA